jgi:hypothetical protein
MCLSKTTLASAPPKPYCFQSIMAARVCRRSRTVIVCEKTFMRLQCDRGAESGKSGGEPEEIVCGIPTFRADTKGIQIHDMGCDSQISQRFLTACNNKKLQKIATLQATDMHRSLATPYMSQLPWCRFLSTTGRQ